MALLGLALWLRKWEAVALLSTGVLVFLSVLWFNPDYWYRRMSGLVLGSYLCVALAPSVNAVAKWDKDRFGRLVIESATSATQFTFFAFFALLLSADVLSRLPGTRGWVPARPKAVLLTCGFLIVTFVALLANLVAVAASLVMPRGAEQLFQAVVGAGQIGHVVAVEQPRPVTLGDLQEVPQRRGQRAASFRPASHSSEQRFIRAANRRTPTPPGIPENLGRLVHERIADLHVRPPSGGVLKAAIHHVLQRRQFPAEAPFFRMPCKLTRIVDNRSCSLNPLGCKGGRPSSVMAERTAEQYPRIASAW